ncbi:MAG TPA: nucleotidyltransferase domain-containing protein [Candidatus Eisenbacteria bacterium]|uniref:Nucleotidyltransferase domain-containing protein n=1 Tax=Eiseniibacteriota bacterium TaxID=2212470 RepID=A0A7V2AUG8_UNCEI|nr:nucleotidyltransferase domain-containing protein [Candidatus Eisenbacteria bacterium]
MSVNGIDGSGPCGSRGSFRLERHPFIERYIETCAEHLAETIGSHEIDDIILCGSFALGEGGISFDSTPALLLSDIDILVVLRRFDTLKRLLPERYELGRSCEALTDDLRFSGRVDVGLMLPEDLERMPPRPGVFDLKRHGRTICGSGRALDLVPEYPADRVGGREAVILLENRIVPLLGRFGDIAAATKGFPYEFLYEIARVYTDIATAFLSISGLYVSGYANRSRLFAEAVEEGRILLPVPEGTASLVAGWTEYKLRPSRARLERDADPEYLGRLWDEASRCIISCWAACESFLQGKGPGSESVQRLLEAREPADGVRTNLRAWRAFIAGTPIGSRLARLLGGGAILFRNDPSSLIRTAALELMNRYVEGRTQNGAKGVSGLTGGGRRTWEEAALEVFELWNETVFGRRNG